MDLPCGSCFTNRYAFHPLVVDGITNELSLRNLCFKIISKHSRLFDTEYICYLPFEILEDFKWFLSVHDLLKYNSIFEQAGIDTNDVWEKHYMKRYGKMAVRKRYFEWREHHVTNPVCDTYQSQYLQNHCSELLAFMWSVENECKCKESLCLYLKYAPSLIFRWKRSGASLGNEINRLVSETVQHLTIMGAKGITFGYKEIKFLRTCKRLKSVYFKNFNLFSMYYCSNKNDHYHVGDDDDDNDENQSEKNYSCSKSDVESVKAILGSEDIKFLLSDKFFESNIKRLNIMSYENITSVCQLDGKGWCNRALKQLTHLTLTGEILSENLVDELIGSLFLVYKDALREPMKYLCLIFNGSLKWKFDDQKYLGQTYAVEEFEVLSTLIEQDAIANMFLQFLQCNRTLSKVNFHNTSISVAQESLNLIEKFTDIFAKSNIQSVTTPSVGSLWYWDICKIIDNAPELCNLKVQGPGYIANIQDLVRTVVNCKHLKTLSLQEINLGEVGKDLLTQVLTSEKSCLTNLDLRFCSILGDDIIMAAETALVTPCSHTLHILDISMNKINRQQQMMIKRLYKSLTDNLFVDIPDRPQMEFVAQM